MSFYLYKSLPSTRAEFKETEIPLSQADIRHVAQVCGAQIAANAEVVVQLVREQGGVNPNTISYIFPGKGGRDGPMDEMALQQVILNYTTWHHQNSIDP